MTHSGFSVSAGSNVTISDGLVVDARDGQVVYVNLGDAPLAATVADALLVGPDRVAVHALPDGQCLIVGESLLDYATCVGAFPGVACRCVAQHHGALARSWSLPREPAFERVVRACRPLARTTPRRCCRGRRCCAPP